MSFVCILCGMFFGGRKIYRYFKSLKGVYGFRNFGNFWFCGYGCCRGRLRFFYFLGRLCFFRVFVRLRFIYFSGRVTFFLFVLIVDVDFGSSFGFSFCLVFGICGT